MKKVSNKKWLCISALCYGMVAIVDIIFALLLGKIVNAATSGNKEILIQNIILAIIMLVGSLLVYWCANINRRNYVMYSIFDIKEKLMKSFYHRGYLKYKEKEDSYYMNMISSDIDLLENNYYLQKPAMFYYIFSFIFASIALISISWKAMLSFILMFFLPLMIPQVLNKKLIDGKIKVSKHNEEFLFEVKEQIQGMESIVTNLSISSFLNNYKWANLRQQAYKKYSGITEGFVRNLSSVCGFIGQLGCMGIGGLLVINNELNIGEMMAAIQLLNSIFNPINALSEMIALIKSTEPIREKITKELNIDECNQDSNMLKNDMQVEYKDFSVGYEEDNYIIKEFNHKFVDGKIYAVIGESGCGKTTLFKCLLGAHDMYKGELTIGGVSIKDISENEIYRCIGYVPQNVYIFNDTIINNITLGNKYDYKKLNRVIEMVKLNELVDSQKGAIGDNGKSISGGEKQRIGLARVLLRNPRIIIFDEPTSALDPDTRNKINEMIFTLKGYTRIVVTHDRRDEYLKQFDGVVVIENK